MADRVHYPTTKPDGCPSATDMAPFRIVPGSLDNVRSGDPEMFDWYTEDQLWLLRQETGFTALPNEEQPDEYQLDRGLLKQVSDRRIAEGLDKCPFCLDAKERKHLAVGTTTGLRVITLVPCPCTFPRLYWHYWSQQVPPVFHDVLWRELQPSTVPRLPLDRQAKIIKFLRDHPDDSFLMTGDGDCGKTHLATALQQRRMVKWAAAACNSPLAAVTCPIFRVNTTRLLDDILAWQFRDKEAQDPDVTPPALTARKIELAAKTGYRPLILLDEIDKFKPTETKLNTLLSLVDTAWTNKCQLIATSNHPVEWFTAHWGKEMAEPTIGRFGSRQGCHTIEFHAD